MKIDGKSPAYIPGPLTPLLVPVSGRLIDAMTSISEAMRHRLPVGIALVVDSDGCLAGVVTDGDIRKALLGEGKLDSPVEAIMTREPIVLEADQLQSSYLAQIKRQAKARGRHIGIRHVPVIDRNRHPVGLVDVNQLVFSTGQQSSTIAVLGLGYVGLTLAIGLAERGVTVQAYDISTTIRAKLAAGNAHVHEAKLDPALRRQLALGRLQVVDQVGELTGCSVYLLCVNTPVYDGKPDLSAVKESLASICPLLQRGDVVVLRSTVPVGTCREIVAPMIEEMTGLVVGRDVGVSFAPERTVAGNALEELHSLPQVVAASDERTYAVVERLFSTLTSSVVRTDRLEEAEMVKLINNTFRDISFAFANEIALVCETYNLRADRLIAAANSGYPRNPIALPSPGVGGPCLTKDPYMLAGTRRLAPVESIATAARRVNEEMPRRVAQRLLDRLRALGKDPAQCRVWVLGLAFKGEPPTNDMRGSPAVDMIAELQSSVGSIEVWDAVVTQAEAEALSLTWRELSVGAVGVDVIAVMNNHRQFAELDISSLVNGMARPGVVFDGFSLYDAEDFETNSGVSYLNISFATPLPA